MGAYRISELAEQTGTPATTLRFYEREGLLPAARTAAGYRSYTEADADRVRFIGAAKHLGLPLGQIRDLLGVWNGGMCREIRDELRPLVASQITAADHRVEELRAFRDRLDAALTRLHRLPPKDGPCDPACAFLQDLPDRVPTPDLRPRSVTPAPAGEQEPIACSLDGADHAERMERWRRMLGEAPRVPAPDGGVCVRLPASRAGALAALVVAEQECCPFFTFHMAFVGAQVELTIGAPASALPLVRALFGAGPLDAKESRNPW